MWEKDKLILKAFKECYTNLDQQIRSGEEVDLGAACVEETEALISYTQN